MLRYSLTTVGIVDVLFAMIFGLLVLFACVVAVSLIASGAKSQRGCMPKAWKYLWLAIGGGTLVRILLSAVFVGYRGIINGIENGGVISLIEYVQGIINLGFGLTYVPNEVMEFYPVTLYIDTVMGLIANIFGELYTDSILMRILIKLPLILADLGISVLIYKLTDKLWNEKVALALGGLYAVCPVFMLASAIWGSEISLLALGILATFYFALDKKYIGMFACFSASLLISRYSVFFVPVMTVFVLYKFISAIIAIAHSARKNDFMEVFADRDKGVVFKFPIYLLCSLAVMYAVSIPLMNGAYGNSFFNWVDITFLYPLKNLQYFTYNGLSVYSMFGRNGVELALPLKDGMFALIFGLIMLALMLVLYLSKRNRANLVLDAAYGYFTISLVFADSNPMMLLPALALILMSFVLIRDKRLLIVFSALAILVFINGISALIAPEYLNSYPFEYFTLKSYKGSELLDEGFGLAINILCSAAAVLLYVYTSFVIIDITMSEKRCEFDGEYRGVIASVRSLFSRS